MLLDRARHNVKVARHGCGGCNGNGKTKPAPVSLVPVDAKDPVYPRGFHAYRWLERHLLNARNVGIWRTLGSIGAGLVLKLLVLAWKARLVVYWRMSKPVSDQVYRIRDEHCADCEFQSEVEDGRFPDRPSRYCEACTCPHSVWAEVTCKNRREGHNCPHGKHPGSRPDLKPRCMAGG